MLLHPAVGVSSPLERLETEVLPKRPHRRQMNAPSRLIACTCRRRYSFPQHGQRTWASAMTLSHRRAAINMAIRPRRAAIRTMSAAVSQEPSMRAPSAVVTARACWSARKILGVVPVVPEVVVTV